MKRPPRTLKSQSLILIVHIHSDSESSNPYYVFSSINISDDVIQSHITITATRAKDILSLTHSKYSLLLWFHQSHVQISLMS